MYLSYTDFVIGENSPYAKLFRLKYKSSELMVVMQAERLSQR